MLFVLEVLCKLMFMFLSITQINFLLESSHLREPTGSSTWVWQKSALDCTRVMPRSPLVFFWCPVQLSGHEQFFLLCRHLIPQLSRWRGLIVELKFSSFTSNIPNDNVWSKQTKLFFILKLDRKLGWGVGGVSRLAKMLMENLVTLARRTDLANNCKCNFLGIFPVFLVRHTGTARRHRLMESRVYRNIVPQCLWLWKCTAPFLPSASPLPRGGGVGWVRNSPLHKHCDNCSDWNSYCWP